MQDNDFNRKIKNRNNWFRNILICIIVLFLMYKFWSVDIQISEFSFSDFLSVLLALFAVGLSVAFYFASSDTSNKFYDNTYKFTKDISDSIGKMDEKFGGQLNNLDKGYSMVMETVLTGKNGDSRQNEIDSLKENYEKTISEKDEKISGLIDTLDDNDGEKLKFQNEIAELNTQLKEFYSKIWKLEKSKNANQSKRTLFSITTNGEQFEFVIEEILYINCRKDGLFIKTINDIINVDIVEFKFLKSRLPNDSFIEVVKDIWVNTDYFTYIEDDNTSATLFIENDNDRVGFPVRGLYYDNLKQHLKKRGLIS